MKIATILTLFCLIAAGVSESATDLDTIDLDDNPNEEPSSLETENPEATDELNEDNFSSTDLDVIDEDPQPFQLQQGENSKYLTQTRIENHTPLNIIDTAVSGVDPWDWKDQSRPDVKFHHVKIRARSSYQRGYAINELSKQSPWSITLYFDDGTTDSFKINQKYAIGDINADFRHATHPYYDIGYRKEDGNTLVITVRFTKYRFDLPNNLLYEAKYALMSKEFEKAKDKLEETRKRAYNGKQIKDIKDVLFAVNKGYGKWLYGKGVDEVMKKNHDKAQQYLNEGKAELVKAKNARSTPEVNLYLGLVEDLVKFTTVVDGKYNCAEKR